MITTKMVHWKLPGRGERNNESQEELTNEVSAQASPGKIKTL